MVAFLLFFFVELAFDKRMGLHHIEIRQPPLLRSSLVLFMFKIFLSFDFFRFKENFFPILVHMHNLFFEFG